MTWRRRWTWMVGAALVAPPLAWLASIAVALPAVHALAHADPDDTSYMRERAQTLGQPPPKLRFTPLDETSAYLVCAVVKSEDRMFFRHHGFDYPQLRKAAVRALHGDSGMGGSTISQQLARNLFLDAERSYVRKLREAGLTIALERSLSKRRILELYLNSAEWGDGVWGATAAAEHYFAKSPRELDLFESLMLASMLPAPRRLLAGDNAVRASLVISRVLHQLLLSGVIERPQYEEVADRARHLFAAIHAGATFASAIAAAAPRDAAPVEPPPALASLVDSECGLDRELDEFERFRRSQATAMADVAQPKRR